MRRDLTTAAIGGGIAGLLDCIYATMLLMGALYGVLLYLVMNFIVVPLAAIGFHAPSLKGAIRVIIPHILLVGPAISLVAARRARTG